MKQVKTVDYFQNIETVEEILETLSETGEMIRHISFLNRNYITNHEFETMNKLGTEIYLIRQELFNIFSKYKKIG